MPRIKVQVPGGNFKSIQTGSSTVIQQVIQNRPTVAAPIPSFASSGGGGVTSITGTANEITASASTGDVTLSISSTYAGQASITTLGTIGTGTWEGSVIGSTYLPASQPQLTTASNLVTVGTIGTGTWAGTTIAIAHGGTGQVTANAALNALLPAQSSSTIDYILQSDGTNASWVAESSGGSGANPTASVGLTAVNGSATTFLRSDAAPALSQAIAPTWTGLHKFQPSGSNEAIHVYGATSQWSAIIDGKDTASDSLGLLVRAGTNSSDYSFYVQDASGTFAYATARGDGLWSFYEPSFGAAALKTVATYDSGSFTGSLTGCSGTPTGTIYWRRVGPIVTMFAQNFTGTSTAATLTMTGLPTALQPASTQEFPCVIMDASSTVHGMVSIGATGTITFFIGRTNIVTNEVAYNSGDFTSSGSKGPLYFTITYSLI